MEPKRSTDLRDSLSLVALGGLMALFLFAPRLFPGFDRPDHPMWKNLYWGSSVADDPLYFLVIFSSLGKNAGAGWRRRWLIWLFFALGLPAIVLVASCFPGLVPRFKLFDGVVDCVGGSVLATLLADGRFGQIWRNLFGRGYDYFARLAPLVIGLLIAGCLGLWVWAQYQLYLHDDYSFVAYMACFALGVICVPIGGRRSTPPQPALPAEA